MAVSHVFAEPTAPLANTDRIHSARSTHRANPIKQLEQREIRMRLRHIEVFNAIMLTGTVSGAARLINVTQPAVSRTLKHAELQLGFPLFQRTAGRMVATPEALTLYPRIERVFAQLEEVQRLALNLGTGHGENETELRVLSVLALAYDVLPKALLFFHERYPSVHVVVSALHSSQIMSAMVLQEADVGFAFGGGSHPALAHTVMGHSRIVCAVPKNLMLSLTLNATRIQLPDLVSLPLVGLAVRDPLGMCLAQVCREAGIRWTPRVTVQTYHAALAMAHHGVGIALIDSVTAAAADLERVAIVPLFPALTLPIQVMNANAQPLSLTAKTLIRCMEKALRSCID